MVWGCDPRRDVRFVVARVINAFFALANVSQRGGCISLRDSVVLKGADYAVGSNLGSPGKQAGPRETISMGSGLGEDCDYVRTTPRFRTFDTLQAPATFMFLRACPMEGSADRIPHRRDRPVRGEGAFRGVPHGQDQYIL